MDFIFSIPYLPYIVGAVVLFVVYQKVAPRLRMRVPAADLDGVVSKVLGPSYAAARVDRTAKRYRDGGNFLAAGKLYEDAGKDEQAIAAYVEGQEFWAAAALLEKAGKREQAGEMYLQAGEYKKAAQLLTEAGKPARAAELFQEKGNNLEAARLFGEAEQWGKAAELYVKSGYPLRAAEAFEKSGDFVRAAQCHEQHFMENVTYSTTYSSTAPSTDAKSAKRAGGLYEKAGDLGKALVIYSRGGYFKEAAAVSMQLGQFARAAEYYLRAEDPAHAADAYERAGDAVKAANLRGEVALKSEKIAEAAAFFQKGEDYLRAAELYESIGMLAEAAGAYEAGDSHAAAGSVYVRAGLKGRAAAAYARAGDHETAARLYEEAGERGKAIEYYEKAGFTFKSGEAAAQAGDRAKAISLLQRVTPDDENYRAATELLARLLIDGGKPSLAAERLQRALGGQPLNRGNLDLHYWLAVSLEASGNRRDALEVYRRIESEDLHHRDVEQRVSRLEAGGTTPPPAMAQAPGSAPPAAAPRASAPPAARDRFLKREELGRGPLGIVFRGEDSTDGKPVALRLLPQQLLKDEALRKALIGDLKAAAQVTHPNLARVLGLIELDGQRCVVSELVAGTSLAETVRKGQRMPVPRILGLGRVLAQLLAFLHGKGIVHGSVQPSNIMAAAGVLKLTDVGLGRLCYTLAVEARYRAPEAGLDPPGDVHQLATVLYQLLTGSHPKSRGGEAATVPDIPAALIDILSRCLTQPAERRPSAADLARELEAVRA
ncbi:MAG TPA: protein kinase [Vicinamibacteria bacterium]|jgi:tetratricopeptide (TPR) repeat protein|nr:protein kinase [Vicinamibacteria bacterium]